MPQPNKKRGRRMQGNKRAHEDVEDVEEEPVVEQSSKRRRSDAPDARSLDNHTTSTTATTTATAMDVPDEALDAAYPPKERPFFGLLDEQEQEHFRTASDKLDKDVFDSVEERDEFVANLYRDAEGKELKLAQSQSASRLLERLIQLSTASQLKTLFQQLSGNFIHLVSHRFASHCCEALFLHAAPFVTEELLAAKPKDPKPQERGLNGDNAVAMETLYLDTLAELEGSMGYLLTDQYASHVFRILLLVLSGKPIDSISTKHLLQGKWRDAKTVHGAGLATIQSLDKNRTVPHSFTDALKQLIAESVAGLDTEKLRALATHPNGNPSLQLLVKLELSYATKDKTKGEMSILRTLLPDNPITAESSSAKFISGLVYDAVGSHLVEKIVENAPDKMFRNLYLEFFKERLASHARNEIAGYVVCRILDRLGYDDLLDAHEILVPTISDLLRKNRTMVVRTLIERCTNLDIDTQAIAVQVDATWHAADGFEIKKLLKFGREAVPDDNDDEHSSEPQDSARSADVDPATTFFERSTQPIKVHFNLLAQAMLIVPGSLSALVLDSLMALDALTLLAMSKDHIVSRTLQQALTTRNASMITTRKLIQHFYGHMGEMAVDSGASHVVDCMWEGTHGLAFIRERIAEELAENESQLRESPCGRAVWKNWKMDLYKRRRRDWIKQSKVKASNDGFQSFSELEINKERDITPKTPLQLARERHAKAKGRKSRKRRSSEGTEEKSSLPNGSARAPSSSGGGGGGGGRRRSRNSTVKSASVSATAAT